MLSGKISMRAAASVALAALAAVVPVLRLGTTYMTGPNSWQLGDWLIGYQGGFVRRGLLGALADVGDEWSGMGAKWLIFGMQFVAWGVLVSFAALLVFRARLPWVHRSLMLVSPAFLPFAVNERAGGFRKEIVLLALFAYFSGASHNGCCLQTH